MVEWVFAVVPTCILTSEDVRMWNVKRRKDSCDDHHVFRIHKDQINGRNEQQK